jgi:hypothetical protein
MMKRKIKFPYKRSPKIKRKTFSRKRTITLERKEALGVAGENVPKADEIFL